MCPRPSHIIRVGMREQEHERDSIFEKYFKLLKFAIARTENAGAELILIAGAEGILQDFVT